MDDAEWQETRPIEKARDHKITALRATHDLLPFVACSCGWNFKGDDIIAPYYARDLLLDEHAAHAARKAGVRKGGAA